MPLKSKIAYDEEDDRIYFLDKSLNEIEETPADEFFHTKILNIIKSI